MTSPQHLSDRYRLDEIVGLGGMSEVHRGRDLRLDRDVAIKVLRADLARNPGSYLRFRLEARHAAALNHPAIVAVFDTGEAQTPTGPQPYIVMEYVEGRTLRDIVANDGPLASNHALEVIADVCQALSFSHRHGIIHRDIKPANIMIGNTGGVKVMDFGIARAIGDTSASLTQTAAVLGTAQYLSPEQARGERVDTRSDLYSAGCVLYEILTGEPPFSGDSALAVAYQHVREQATPPSQRNDELSRDLDAVVLKALAKNPDNRYQTAAEMHADLIRVRAGDTPHAPRVLTESERRTLFDSTTHHADGDLVAEPDRSVPRWLVAVGLVAALIIASTVVLQVRSRTGQQLHVPDIAGKSLADAIAELQSDGFAIRTRPTPDNVVPTDHVVGTEPDANTNVAAQSEVTLDVSTGPARRAVPDVMNLSYPDATAKLGSAEFTRNRLEYQESSAQLKDKVLQTVPPSGQVMPVTTEITIVVGSGPRMRQIPNVIGQTTNGATRNLNAVGFPTILTAPADSMLPAGQVLSTDPSAGATRAVDTPITLTVSKGNQFAMPDLNGMFYTDLQPQLALIYGFTGPLLRGADIPVTENDDRNRVLQQQPAPGTPISRDGTITLRYGA